MIIFLLAYSAEALADAIDQTLMVIFEQAGITWDHQQKLKAKADWKAAKNRLTIDDWNSSFLKNQSDPAQYIAQALNHCLQKAAERDALKQADQKKAIQNNDFLSYLLGSDAAKALRQADSRDGWEMAQKKIYERNYLDEEAYAHIGMLIDNAIIQSGQKQHRQQTNKTVEKPHMNR